MKVGDTVIVNCDCPDNGRENLHYISKIFGATFNRITPMTIVGVEKNSKDASVYLVTVKFEGDRCTCYNYRVKHIISPNLLPEGLFTL